ncbi:MAG: hypothetical protein R3A79_17560 [Nannocystaceae bacterium]
MEFKQTFGTPQEARPQAHTRAFFNFSPNPADVHVLLIEATKSVAAVEIRRVQGLEFADAAAESDRTFLPRPGSDNEIGCNQPIVRVGCRPGHSVWVVLHRAEAVPPATMTLTFSVAI